MNSGSNDKTFKEYEKYMFSILDKYSNDLINTLKGLLKLNYNPKIKRLDFEVHQNSNTITIMMHSMTKDRNEVFNTKDEKSFFADSMCIVKKINYFPKTKEYSLDRFYDKDDKKADLLYIDTVIAWFSKCWDKADCKKLPIKSTIQRHDSSFFFDLKKKSWTKEK